MPKSRKIKSEAQERKELDKRYGKDYPILWNDKFLKEFNKFDRNTTCQNCGNPHPRTVEVMVETFVQRSNFDEKININLNKHIDFLKNQIVEKDNIVQRMIEEVRYAEILINQVAEQNEEIWKERNDAILAYKALSETGKIATALGIDIEKKRLPNEEGFLKDYKLLHKHRITETGKIKYEFRFVPPQPTKEENEIQGHDIDPEKTKN